MAILIFYEFTVIFPLSAVSFFKEMRSISTFSFLFSLFIFHFSLSIIHFSFFIFLSSQRFHRFNERAFQ